MSSLNETLGIPLELLSRFQSAQPSVRLLLCVPIELLSTYSTQCTVDPVGVPHKAIFNLLHLPTHCDAESTCGPIEQLSTYFNPPQPSVMLIQPSVMLIQCVSPTELLSTYFNPPQPGVMLTQSVSPTELLSTYFNLPTQCDVDPVCMCP